jgi:hypothetical protein
MPYMQGHFANGMLTCGSHYDGMKDQEDQVIE